MDNLPLLTIFSDNQGLDLTSEDFIEEGFNPFAFNHNQPHTIREWQSFFFTVNPDSREADEIPYFVVRNNWHAKAFSVYLQKKSDKGLIKGYPQGYRFVLQSDH